MVLSVAIAVASMTLGILASDIFAKVPPSFSILAVAASCYLAAYAATLSRVSAQGSNRASSRFPNRARAGQSPT
jgi:hypothetical protein